MARGARGPEAKPVVMFGGEDHRAKPSRPRRPRPLPGVEPGGRENRRVLRTVAPLSVGERVHAEMQEERQLVLLPFQLRARRRGPSVPCEQIDGPARPACVQRSRGGSGRGSKKVSARDAHRTVNSPRKRMSFDDAPIITLNTPGSTTECRSRSRIWSCAGPRSNASSIFSPGSK